MNALPKSIPYAKFILRTPIGLSERADSHMMGIYRLLKQRADDIATMQRLLYEGFAVDTYNAATPNDLPQGR